MCFRALEAEAIELQGKDWGVRGWVFSWWIERLGVGREVNQGQIFACVFHGLEWFIWCPVVFSMTLVGWLVCQLCLS